MRLDETTAIAARRRLRMWMTGILAATLMILTVAGVTVSWRQFVIVKSTATSSTDTDDLQRAAFLAAREMELIEGSLREPDGEERRAVAGTSEQLLEALGAMAAHDEPGHVSTSLIHEQRGLLPTLDRYFALLDSGEIDMARVLLENVIEPATENIMSTLLVEQEAHMAEYSTNLVRAERESRLLLVGTWLSLLLGMAVVGFAGWTNRTHRRLIERMAAHDSLTGLPNRPAFHARTELALDRTSSGGPPPTVLMLDLDGFKDVNDTLGHHVGDLLLIEVGARIRGAVRDNDTVARLGGDEFAVLLTGAEPAVGEQAATRILDAINSPFTINELALDIEVSLGIATARPGDDVATIVRNADTAMYAAKEHRLGHVRFDPAQTSGTAARITMLGDLRRALDAEDELQLHYQPKIDLGTGEPIGAEALARWQHPTHGLVAPNEFIPVLEGTSLIHRFTAHVLDVALGQVRAWLDAGHRVPVAVNVSTRCLLDAEFPATVTQALARAGVPGHLLCVEITENTVMADPERAIDVLRRIRVLGVKTAIDDFGTGYSSMAYLRSLPLDEIKVDRSFVRDMATDRSNYVLVESAVDLGHNLGLAVVAEGVEDLPTVAALAALGCDIAQGFHFARPLPADDFTAYLATREAARDTVPDPA
jgi:diguanylate cyclase (GGDEF)-like protein